MISVRDQRSFLELAKPRPGYHLSYCVGTTFSLDLECLLQLALNSRNSEAALSEIGEGKRHMECFATLQEFQNKAIVFCQNCRIKASRFLAEETRASRGIRRLLAMLDATVVAVSAPGVKASFHPKVWLFRYDSHSGTAPPEFVLGIQSRNLTAAKDWDISASFTGSLSRSGRRRNDPLAKFLWQLQSHAKQVGKHKLMRRVMRDIPRIRFNTGPDFKGQWEFLFQWPKHQGWELIEPSRYSELIAISPFLGNTVGTLKDLSTVPKFTLITGPTDIETIKKIQGLAKRTYVMAGSNETAWAAGEPGLGQDGRPDQFGLHAKIYLGLDKFGKVDILVGSANLTDAAFRGKNCEAMVRLKGHRRHLRNFESNFIYKNPKKGILHPWLRRLETLTADQRKPGPDEGQAEKVLEDLRSRISMGAFRLRFPARDRKAFLSFEGKETIHLAAGVRAQFRLATSDRTWPLGAVLTGSQQVFESAQDERTEFLVISLVCGESTLRFVTVAESNLNRSARSRSALSHVVKDADTFFELLGLILGTPPSTDGTGFVSPPRQDAPKRRTRNKGSRVTAGWKSLLEPLLLHGIMEPDREEEIERAICAFAKARHPAEQKRQVTEFSEFWKLYRNTSRDVRRHG